MNTVPRPSIPLGRVLSLSESRQQVLRHLADSGDEQRASVDTAATAIAAAESVDLSTGTVKRLLYELAEIDVIERVTRDNAGSGRSPSRLEPRFPTRVFCRLYDFTHS